MVDGQLVNCHEVALTDRRRVECGRLLRREHEGEAGITPALYVVDDDRARRCSLLCWTDEMCLVYKHPYARSACRRGIAAHLRVTQKARHLFLPLGRSC